MPTSSQRPNSICLRRSAAIAESELGELGMLLVVAESSLHGSRLGRIENVSSFFGKAPVSSERLQFLSWHPDSDGECELDCQVKAIAYIRLCLISFRMKNVSLMQRTRTYRGRLVRFGNSNVR